MIQSVLIADDHPMIQKGLKMLLQDVSPAISATSVFNGSDIFNALAEKSYDFLILDINMPGMSFQVFEQVILQYPELRVLMYSQNPEELHAVRYLKAGAFGYVEKKATDDELLEAIRQIMLGKKYCSTTITDLMVQQLRGKGTQNPFETLSNREYDVALAMLKGSSMSEICEQLHLSPSTVSTYKTRLFEKLKVQNMADLFAVGRAYQLI